MAKGEQIVIYPNRAEYIKPYDDLSSNQSAEDILEKAALLEQQTFCSWGRRRPILAEVFIHIGLLAANVTF